MKTLRLLLMFILVASIVNQSLAQKIKKTDLVSYDYIQLPTNPLPKEYKSYLLKVLTKKEEDKKIIFSKFEFEGFEKKDSGLVDFTIEIKTSSYEKEPQLKVRTDSDGKTTYYYKYEISFTTKATLFDKDQKEIYSIVKKRIKPGFTSNATSKGGAKVNLGKSIKLLKKSNTKIIPVLLSKAFNDKSGFIKKSNDLNIYYVKAKKYKYDDFDFAYNTAIKAANIIKADSNSEDDCLKAYLPAIKNWEQALEESEIANKKARINKDVTCAAYYNLGNAFLLCKDYDKAIENFRKISEIDKNFSDVDELMLFCEDLKKREEANR